MSRGGDVQGRLFRSDPRSGVWGWLRDPGCKVIYKEMEEGNVPWRKNTMVKEPVVRNKKIGGKLRWLKWDQGEDWCMTKMNMEAGARPCRSLINLRRIWVFLKYNEKPLNDLI